MQLTLQDRLLRREIGDKSNYSAVSGIYGDKCWINDLDIVNELGGHSGCVNALRQVCSSLPASGRRYNGTDILSAAAGRRLEGSWLPAAMTSISISTHTNPTHQWHRLPSPLQLPRAILLTYSPSNSCLTLTTAHSLRQLEMLKCESLILSTVGCRSSLLWGRI